MSFGSDRRAHVRVGFDCPIHWGKDGTTRFGWARDASEVGAGFTVPTEAAPEIGESVSVIFRLDNYCDWQVCEEARVVWRRDTGTGMSHVGVVRTSAPDGTPPRHRHLFQWT